LGHVRPPACRMSAHIELNHKIHVLTKKEELDSIRVPGKVVIVLDIIFATTTMVAALAHGAAEVLPVLDEAAARALGGELAQDSYVLSGELYAETLAGFVHPAPLSLISHGIEGKSVIYSTTNRDGIGQNLNLGIFNAAQTHLLAEQQIDVADGLLIVESSDDQVFVVIRLTPPQEAVRKRFETALKGIVCGNIK